MPGPDKKQMEACQKAVAAEMDKLQQKTKKQLEEARQLCEEKDKAKKDKDKLKEIDLKLKKLEKEVGSEAEQASKRISLQIKDYVPQNKDDVPEFEKGMSQWYRDFLKKEPGLDVGGGKRLNGSVSIAEKKVEVNLTWKFR